MSRLLVVACAVVLLVGLSANRSDAEPACGARGTPPAPNIEAVRDGHRVQVDYSLDRPAGCLADAVHIAVSSVEHPRNVGPSATNGLVCLTGSNGSLELDLPPLELPPYEVRATSLTPRGRRSAVTVLRLPSTAEQCRGDTCLQQAQDKLERCIRGLARRRDCRAYVWRTRPPLPYEPVRGVTREALERSFTTLLGTRVACASTSECAVEGEIFMVSGYRERAKCWRAEHRLDRYRGCVDWNWNA
jgi:hypothetical protein